MMEEMQKAELERLKKQMRKPQDPWAVDFNETLAKQGQPESESLIDKAKSFSF